MEPIIKSDFWCMTFGYMIVIFMWEVAHIMFQRLDLFHWVKGKIEIPFVDSQESW